MTVTTRLRAIVRITVTVSTTVYPPHFVMKATLDLRVCNLPFCNVNDSLRVCSRCKTTYYCGKDHQRRDWKSHRNQCNYINQLHSGFDGGTGHFGTIDVTREITTVNHANETNQSPASTGSTFETPVKMTDPSQLQVPSRKPFAQKRSKEEGDSSYVDLTNLDLSQASGASEVVEQDTLSDQILRSHSYPLTPLTDDDEEPGGDGNRSTGSGTGRWQIGATEQPMPSGPPAYPPNRVGILKQPREWHEKLTHYLVDCMKRFGICVIDRVLGKEKADGILQDVLALHQEGRFSEGQLVKSNEDNPAQQGAIRGDKIMWTDGVSPPSRNIRYLISQMDTIIQMTNGLFENITISSRTKVRTYRPIM